MILDEQNLFSDNQKITASAASENIINFGTREMAAGTPVELFIQVTEDFNNLTNLKFTVQTAADEAFTSPVDLIDQTVALDNLKKGMVSSIKFLPAGNLGYMRLYYTITGSTAPTTGAIFAGISDGIEQSFHS